MWKYLYQVKTSSRTTTSSTSTHNNIKHVHKLKDAIIDTEGYATSKGAKGINKIILYHQII